MQDMSKSVFLGWLGTVWEGRMHHWVIHNELFCPLQLCAYIGEKWATYLMRKHV